MDKEYCLRLFERYLSGKASLTEINQLKSFLKNDAQLNQWMESQIMDSPGTILPDVQARMLEKIRSQAGYTPTSPRSRNQGKTMKTFLLRFSVVAAILLAFVFIPGMLYLKEPARNSFEVYANKGEKASLTLPEGSKVAINSGSKVIYYSDFNNNRHIQLEGEAYFEVASNPSKPFIVQCNDIQVKVLGTSFGVKAYNDESNVSVVLSSGKIKLITPGGEIEMAPNDRVVYSRIRRAAVLQKVEAEDYTGWRQNRLRFENESLQAIMEIISRMHNIDIVFENQKIKNLHFTGTIDNTSIESALNAIVLTSSVHYGVKEGIIYLSEKE